MAAVSLWPSLQRTLVVTALIRKEGWGAWVRVQMFLKACACCVKPWIFTLNISFGKGCYKTVFTKQPPFLLKSYVAHESLRSIRRARQDLFYSFHCVKWYLFLNGIVCILWWELGESLLVSKRRRVSRLTCLLLCDTCLFAMFYLCKNYQQLLCAGCMQRLHCRSLFHPPNSFMRCRY